MANDRMYIRCKGCGDLHFLAKCYDDGYFTTHEGEELRQGLDDFFDRHKWCYRDKYYGGFELVYESDDWLEKQKEQKPEEKSEKPIIPEWSEEALNVMNLVYRCIRKVLAEFAVYTENEELLESREETVCYYSQRCAEKILKSLRPQPSWKPSEEQQSGSSALKAEGTNE